MATSAPPSALIVPPPTDATNRAETLELRDVKPPLPIVNLWLYAGAALLLAALVAVLIAWLLRQRRLRKEAPPPLVIVPPHRRARDQLRAALDLIHNPKAFISQVADTLRFYLEERFDLKAPERTSEEFLDELQSSSSLDPKQKEILADFLARCDLVKFAQHQPAEPELRGLWETAHRLVEETSPDALTENPPSGGETSPEPSRSDSPLSETSDAQAAVESRRTS